jgi:S-adenosylmethionine:tRNA ribosyltransferase-isomerase
VKTRDFYYGLPQKLIAQTPIQNRDESRLLVYERDQGVFAHRRFYDVLEYLNPTDALVLNDTRVLPARLYGQQEETGGKMEFLLLKRLGGDCWETLVQPGRRAKEGAWFSFGDGLLRAQILEKTDSGGRIVKLHYDGLIEHVLERIGEMPLPPYIKEKLRDQSRYQTVYAQHDGSAAAPTAGLHFTDELLQRIKDKGVSIVYITLHVGLGTFRPVKTSNIEEHPMHAEYYSISDDVAHTLNETRRNKGRVIAVGTTCTRVLETVADENGHLHAGSGETQIFIYPGYTFRAIDGLITNFHLPESTLLMLVCALMGKHQALAVYEEAVRQEYRFFSFGDAMLVL